MDIKPDAVPFAGENIIVPILTTMTAGEWQLSRLFIMDIKGTNYEKGFNFGNRRSGDNGNGSWL
jgi:hypothetical protein